MNRYPLNSRVIGAGSQSPLSYVAAIQNFVLHVAATARAIRGMRVTQSLTLDREARAVITRLFAAVQELRLNVATTTKTYYMKYAEVAQNFVLSNTATARQRIKHYAQAAQTFALTSMLTTHQYIKTYAAAVQNFSLDQTSKYARYVYPRVAHSLSAAGSIRVKLIRWIKFTNSFVLGRTIKIRTAIGATITETLVLASSIIASDRTTLPANIERTVEIPESSRMVVVPGESYESGV